MLELVTLGRLQLTRDDTPLLLGRRKLLVVLAYIARSRGRLVTRTQLASLFWPVEDEIRARRSVRQALTELRRATGDALLERDEGITVVAGLIDLDASSLESAVAAGEYRRAVDLWGGDFLHNAEDVGSEEFRVWLEAERHRVRSQFGQAAEAIADQAERRGEWAVGLEATESWSEACPYDERASMRHIRLLSLAGRRAEAGDWYAAFVARLRNELGEEPSAEFLRHTAVNVSKRSSDDRFARPGVRRSCPPT